MALSRREFLKSLAVLTAGASFHPLAALADNGGVHNCLLVGSDAGACMVDLQAQVFKRILLNFRPHSFLPHPSRAQVFFAFEKWGPNAAVVDFEKHAARPFDSGEGHHFYGHGIYADEHKAVFIARVDTKTGMGHLVGYDPDSLEVVKDFQVAPGTLHESHRLPDGSVMFASSGIRVANYVKPADGKRVESSALVRLDIKTGKILSRMSIADDDQTMGHFTVTRTGAILALSGPRPGAKGGHGDLFYSPDGIAPLRKLEWGALEGQIGGEMLSIALNADHTRAMVTNPMGEKVILVDMMQGKIINAVAGKFNGMVFDPGRGRFVASNQILALMDDGLAERKRLPVVWARKPTELIPPPLFDGAHSIVLPVKV